jgi:RNA polymerase sigma-70 factor (ECF subfamily)
MRSFSSDEAALVAMWKGLWPMVDRAAPAPLSPTEFTLLVTTYERALCGFLYGLVGNAEQARDLAQDVFHDAWRAALRSETPFVQDGAPAAARRWLYRSAYHRAISALRRYRLIRWESIEERFEREPEPFFGAITFEDAFAAREAIRAALGRLAPRDAACLLLRVVEGLSVAEIGAVVGASPAAVTKRLTRAKQRMRRIYLAHEPQPLESSQES